MVESVYINQRNYMAKMNKIFYDIYHHTDKFQADVFIEFYRPRISFTIEGQIMKGYIPYNHVSVSDNICLRYSYYLPDYVDIEVFTNHRFCWFRLNHAEFDEIKHLLLAYN